MQKVIGFPVMVSAMALLATQAFAQNAAPANDVAGAPPAPAGLEEIIVTAQKRSENLQRVPISITAITATALARSGVSGISTLAAVTPSLNLTSPAGNLTPFLRGVGTEAAGAGNSASVATYIDGVYIASMATSLFEFNNIERIEVLKGPQGTLFGRNTTGGVINVITRDPSFDPQLKLRLGYGNYDTVEASGYASAGLAEGVAADISALYRDQQDGWSYNFASGKHVAREKDLLLRSKLLFTPGPDTRIVVAGDYERTNSANAGINQPYGNSITIGGIPHQGRFWDTNQDTYVTPTSKQGGVSLNIEQNLGDLKLRSISAYRKDHSVVTTDLDGTQIPLLALTLNERNQTFTQELQLLSTGSGPFQWIVGAFYLDGYSQYDPFRVAGIVIPGGQSDLLTKQDARSISGFAQASYEIFDGTKLTGGLRYTVDKYTFHSPIPDERKTEKKPTWRLSLDHQFGSNLLGYISYNRGFRSGTFNLTDPSAPALKPEVLDAYEAGFKADMLDRKVRLNLASYYYNFKDIQLVRTTPTAQQTLNASRAEIYGFDADLSAALTDYFTLSAGAAYVHGRYKSFSNAPISTPNAMGGNTYSTGDASGNTIIRTPKWTLNLGGNYVIPSSVGEFNLSANYYYNDGWFADPDNRVKTKSYSLVSGSIGWTSPDKRYEAHVWGKNLTDAHYYAHVTEVALGDLAIPAPPRTFGVTLGVNF